MAVPPKQLGGAGYDTYETVVRLRLKNVFGCKKLNKYAEKHQSEFPSRISDKTLYKMVLILPDEILKKIADFHTSFYDKVYFDIVGKRKFFKVLRDLMQVTCELVDICECGSCEPVFDKPYSSAIYLFKFKCACCEKIHFLWRHNRRLKQGFDVHLPFEEEEEEDSEEESGEESEEEGEE